MPVALTHKQGSSREAACQAPCLALQGTGDGGDAAREAPVTSIRVVALAASILRSPAGVGLVVVPEPRLWACWSPGTHPAAHRCTQPAGKQPHHCAWGARRGLSPCFWSTHLQAFSADERIISWEPVYPAGFFLFVLQNWAGSSAAAHAPREPTGVAPPYPLETSPLITWSWI